MVQANNKVQIKNILKTMAPYTTGAGSTPAVFKPNRSMKYSMHRPKMQKYIIIFPRYYHTLLRSLSYEGIRYRLSMVALTFVRGFYV